MPEETEIEIPITFHVFVDKRNVRTVLSSPEDTDKEIARIEEGIAQQQETVNNAKEDEFETSTLRLKIWNDLLDKTKQIRDVFLPAAQVEVYFAVIPSYPDWMKIRKSPGVRTVQASGTIVTDREAYGEKLLPLCLRRVIITKVEDGKTKEFTKDIKDTGMKNISPDMALRLHDALDAIISPSEAALPFS